ncbi:NUDIX hydrolase [Falsibacillus albus]|uniref:NUDIX domain-containing protein n=1 Tax=Falsibacillus albus TaxID=2478915 RepID=A0A3L7JUC4_9BACI|nr:NUDIX domain-containing protein [Falsibacillus albus]RLQ94336.1 NUDIX domain-containing protein [Falsibacillus albus]
MRKGIIRPIVICLFRYDDKILVAEGIDPADNSYFYRPIGGGIEYGEKSSAALKREVKEEINASIDNLEFLGTIENIFTYNGEVGHEIVQVYDAIFIDDTFYEIPAFEGIEDSGDCFKVMWKPWSDFISGGLRLVPEELLTFAPSIQSMQRIN